MTEFDTIFLVFLSLAASVVSATTGFGGGMLLLALSTLILPIDAVIPLHASIILTAQGFRVWAFRQDILWDVVVPFVLGSSLGAALGAYTYALLPEIAISTLLGLTMLALVWMPPLRWRIPIPMPRFSMGIVHTWISTITGVGGLLQGYMLRGGYLRHQIVGTIAGCGLGLTAFKVLGYIWVGFDYRPYLLVIGLATLAGLIGTWIGKRALQLISDTQFRVALRWLLTLMALRLFWVAWTLR